MKAVYVAMMAAAGIVMAGQAHADEALAKSKNCLSCHAVDKKLVGPSYKEVAAKYKGDAKAPAMLAAKVKAGGKGTWGQIPMAAHPTLSEPDATALANGMAFSTRAIGALSRPFYPDGVSGTGPGPLSKPFAQWSPFSTGLQYDLLNNQIGQILTAYLSEDSLPILELRPELGNAGCTRLPQLRNGLQIFPGGVLVGLLALHDASAALGVAGALALLSGLRADSGYGAIWPAFTWPCTTR